MKINVVSKILEANEKLAEDNRKLFEQNGLFVINLMSAPGAGKTSLLTSTIKKVKGNPVIGVIEGDIQGTYDAEQIGSLNAPVVQINTGGACHLDANMVTKGLEAMDVKGLDLIIIENVGNLVCPAEFDTGAVLNVMLLSVPEGDDKPLKYPLMFTVCDVLIVTKMDLLPHVPFSIEAAIEDAHRIQPNLDVMKVCSLDGTGIGSWCEYLIAERTERLAEYQ